jgi:hypothetical protein
MEKLMSTPLSKTIDNIGLQSYVKYEEDRKFFDAKFLDDSQKVASQIGMDVFEPILESEYQILFDIGKKETLWSTIYPPKRYNEQTKRLFVYQLAPRLGPADFIETLMSRVEGKRQQEKEDRSDKEKKFMWEEESPFEEVEEESKKLLQLLQNINVLNKMMQHINAERYRYNKG